VPSFKTSGQATFFRYLYDGTLPGTVLGVGRQYRVSPQAYYYAGPFGLLTEYVLSSQEVKKGTNIATLKNVAWQAAGSFVLTGEKASYKGVVPNSALEGGSGGWGAWEIAARFSQLNVDHAAYPVFANPQQAAGMAREWAVGLNWYLNRNVKFVLDYDRSSFVKGAASGNRQPENGILTRLQFAY
jgi:phosphate-selective porin OprO/OprP